ncbi:SusC/RagA family TonB-linked outer membrane protein [Mucilaginibacter sp.]
MKILYLLFFLLSPSLAICQLTGTVINDHHEPLKGITVTVKGTKSATTTNDKGQFKLPLSPAPVILRFTATNVEPLEIIWTGQKDLTVVLTTRLNKLDEVQVIAYGTNTQRFNVGSVTKVTAEDIDKQAVTNPLSALEGMVPGLVITPTSGIPGSSISVQIRGQNTLNGTGSFIPPQDNPLYVIDGVPFAPQNSNVNQFASLASPGISGEFNNPYGGISPFNSIDPADIESIEVLRDADATAIYGSRGGNGVILITTKKGKAGNTETSLSIRKGISFIGATMPMMNTQQYVAMRNEAFKNDGLTPNTTLYDPAYAPDLLIFDTTKYTNWKKVFLGNTAHNTNATASVSGGSNETQFRLGAGFNQDTYLFPGDYADNRASFSASIHHTSPDKKLTLDFSTNYSYDKNNSSGAPNLLAAYTLEPDYPSLTDSKGNLVWNYNGVPLNGSQASNNPFSYLKENYSIQNVNLNSSLLIAYQFIKGLTLRSSFGYNTFNSQEYTGDPLSAQNPANNPVASASFGTNNFTTWIIEPQLEYKGSSQKSNYAILLGSTFQKNSNGSTVTDASGYINDALINSISGAPTTYSTDNYNEYKYTALFGRINYRWDDKYILDINARRDGSSRFGPDKQFGNFGSVGSGWLFNEEPFVKDNLKFLSYGKLKGSYGITGSDAVADYQYLSRYAPTNYPYQGGIGYLPQNLYNPQLSWATTKKLEAGIELGFLQDRLLFSATWYRDRTGNQLVPYQLPSQTGFTSVFENLNALVQNTGVELSLQSTVVKSEHFSWSSSFNMTIPQNKLLAFPGLASSSYSTTYLIGQPLSVIKGFKYAGVNPQTGLFQFYTASGQLTENPAPAENGAMNDYDNLGTTDPKFYGGFQNSFKYKDFQLDIYLTYKKQMGMNYLYSVYANLPGLEINEPTAILSRWQSPGQQATIEKFSSQYNDAYNQGNNFFQSSGVYSDASYIRLKTLSLSYTLPDKIAKRFKARSLRVYLTGQNLFTITDYKGNDPETQNFYGVPVLKSLSAGLQLNL